MNKKTGIISLVICPICMGAFLYYLSKQLNQNEMNHAPIVSTDLMWRYNFFSEQDLEDLGMSSLPSVFKDADNQHLYYLPIDRFKVRKSPTTLSKDQSTTMSYSIAPIYHRELSKFILQKDPKAQVQILPPLEMQIRTTAPHKKVIISRNSKRDSGEIVADITSLEKDLKTIERYSSQGDLGLHIYYSVFSELRDRVVLSAPSVFPSEEVNHSRG